MSSSATSSRAAQAAARVAARAAKYQNGPISQQIQHKLREAFAPTHLEVHNESYRHHVEAGAEKHFKVVVVSDKFEGKSLIQRHRMVNEVLKEELATDVHALGIQSATPSQWANSNAKYTPSPNCLDGINRE